jgi:rubrerythrin
MPRIQVYFSEEEHEWLKRQPAGAIRIMVQSFMKDQGEFIEKVKRSEVIKTPEEAKEIARAVKGEFTVKVETPSLEKGWGCPKCGGRLPYFKASKCKSCGHKMKWS